MILYNAKRFQNRNRTPAEELHYIRKHSAQVATFDQAKRVAKPEPTKEQILDTKMEFQIEKWLHDR